MSHHGSVNPDVLGALDAAFFGCVDPRELIAKANDASEVHTPAPLRVRKKKVAPSNAVPEQVAKALAEIVNHRRMGAITTEQALEMAAEIEKGLGTAHKLFAAGKAMKGAQAASDEHVAAVASQWGRHSSEGAAAVENAKTQGARQVAHAGANAVKRNPKIPVKPKRSGILAEVDQVVPKPKKLPGHLLSAGAGAGVGAGAVVGAQQVAGKKQKGPVVKSGSVQGGSKKEIRTGQALNVLATAGGGHALYLTAKDIAHTAKAGVQTGKHEAVKAPGKIARVAGKAKILKPIVDNPKRAALAAAGAWGGLHTAELAGDAIAARALHRQSKVAKAGRAPGHDDLTWSGTISKVDTDKRLVFGWCSLSKVNGEEVYDLQGDYVPIETTEDAAYRYVIHSRKGGDMHRRVTKHAFGVKDEPLHTADLVESMVVTPEKLKALGLTEEQLPLGWWVGFKVNDDTQWADVKAGKRPAFSIHGSGIRVPVEESA